MRFDHSITMLLLNHTNRDVENFFEEIQFPEIGQFSKKNIAASQWLLFPEQIIVKNR